MMMMVRSASRRGGFQGEAIETLLMIAVACGLGAGLASCAGEPRADAGANGAAAAAGAPGDQNDAQRLAESTQLLALMEQAQAASPPRSSGDGAASVARRTNRPAITEQAGAPPEALERAEAGTGADASAAATERARDSSPSTPADRRRHALRELAEALRAEAAAAGSPVAPAARLAALELIEPGAAGGGAAASGAIPPRDAELLEAWRALCAAGGSALASDEPASFAQAIREAGARLIAAPGGRGALAIPRAALCSRVEAFGLYNELPGRRAPADGAAGYALLAGRRHRAIVYLELEGFGTREAVQDGAAGHRVELSLDLSLYAYRSGESADMLAWRKPDQAIVDFSRNVRRDFFLVQMIELPETLGVGSYRLKATVRDRATGASAETIVVLDLVADASALSNRR